VGEVSVLRRGRGLLEAASAGALEVAIGWPDPEDAEVARINEAGDREGRGRPPARPTLGPMLEEEGATLIRIHSRRALRAAARGRDVRGALEALAWALEYALRVRIDRAGPGNAPSTIRRKGFDDPLRGSGRDRIFMGARALVRRRRGRFGGR
jgi:hypothetical protein